MSQLSQNAPYQNNRGVRTEHPYYISMKSTWKKCRDVVAGEDAMHDARDTYIFKLKNQAPEDYTAYVYRTPFYNATARTIGGMKGMLFRKDMLVEVPTGIETFLDDVDLQGTSIQAFAEKLVEDEILVVGRVGVLVDYTKLNTEIDTPLTIAQVEKLGMRPLMQIYKTEDIINWKFKQINNVWSLCQVVLCEVFTQPKLDEKKQPCEFENVSENRYRVLDIDDSGFYRNRVFRINENGKDELVSETYPLMNNATMLAIPFEIYTSGGLTFNPNNPPMIDLININISHYRTSADYEHGCHFTGLPTFWIAGYKSPISDPGTAPEKIYLGSQAAIVMADPAARAGFVEFTGQGLQSLENNLNRKEAQMAVLGARMIAGEKAAAETATTTAIHRTGENSVLSSISISVSTGLTQTVSLFAEWALGTKSNTEIKIQLNKDFLPVTVDGPTLTAYTQTWQAGGLKDEEYFDLIQRGDLIEADITFEEHQAMVNTGKPPEPTPVAGGGKPGENNVHQPPNPTNAH